MQLQNLLSLASLTMAAALPATLVARNKDVLPGYCCFSLKDTSSGNTLQQARTGQAWLSSTNPTGWYCLDVSSSSKRVLYDDANNACIVDSRGRLYCVDPTPGGTPWTLKNDELVLGGSTTFAACSASGGKTVHGGQRSGCTTIKLKATAKKGSC